MSEREYPKIYLEFEGKKEINGRRRQYWIQDATENYFQEIHDYLEYFMEDEPMNKYLRSVEDPQTMSEFHLLLEKELSEKLSLVCLTKDDSHNIKLAGFNILVESKANDETEYNLQGEQSKRINKIVQYVESKRNLYKEFNLQCIMKSTGLYVVPEYRGEGLGERILEAREYLCRHVGLSATLTTFSSIVSQIVASRAGFKDYYVIEFEELGKIDSDMNIPGIQNHTKLIKSMYKLYK